MPALTMEELRKTLPEKMSKTVNQDLLDSINKVLDTPELFETYRDNFTSYTSVLNDGRFKIMDYVNAVKYCSHKLMGCTNLEAFIKTFPDRYNSYLANGTSSKDIASYITAYNKNKLVNSIMEQSLIPSWVLNQDLYQKAINIQAELMVSANSEKVRSDAANSLLNHLRPPEVSKVELSVGLKKDSAMEDLKNTLTELALKQQQFIGAGVTQIKDVAQQKLVKVIEHDS